MNEARFARRPRGCAARRRRHRPARRTRCPRAPNPPAPAPAPRPAAACRSGAVDGLRSKNRVAPHQRRDNAREHHDASGKGAGRPPRAARTFARAGPCPRRPSHSAPSPPVGRV